jgi:hypothetical protein
MRRMMTVCAVAAMLAAVSGSDVAIARGGGGHGGGGHGGGGHGGGGMGRGGGMGHAGFGFGGGRMGGISFATARPAMVFGHGFHGRHHPFVRTRFAFVGGGGGWGYGCYTRVWTYWGWVWRNACY